MATISPSGTIRTREVIGEDQFIQRREVFDKHDTVFMPGCATPPPASCAELEPTVTTNRSNTATNFKRNAPTYSSMRESRIGPDDPVEFRPRKYSDNFTSELNQTDDTDYRNSMSDRTRRLSKLRRDFLNSNLHDTNDSPFARKGTRASLPAGKTTTYKVEIPSIYKFPFAEPYVTLPSVQKHVDSDQVDDKNKENEEPENFSKHQSLPVATPSKIDHHKLFEELVKRYSPERKPIDWHLPATRPKVVGSVRKSVTSGSDEPKFNGDVVAADDVISKGDVKNDDTNVKNEPTVISDDVTPNDESHNSTISITELAEKNDRVPELSIIQRQISREDKRPHIDKLTDLNIPALIEKMNDEGEQLENHEKDKKKVKRKRSFLDKLLGRKKEYVKRQ